MNDLKRYSIGHLSKLTNVSVRALRHCEQSGLLVAVRSENGYRYFDERSIEYVLRIAVLLRNGFNIEEIRPVASMFEIEGKSKKLVCADVIRMYQSKLAEIDVRIADLQTLRNRAANRLEFLIEQRNRGEPVLD